ncbi:TetR/AcrR family transcriptional regulator [Actinoplanes subtropicus]|uniref:TetR/AcrR family transcriptional regulator n=1 Tax=Actinoplanes subtropicus TaxID=543632 RepID=UPI0004C443DE|nr:TetR/AcrR family transcriptional regulator [Actinoplanes subtropicus]
MTLTGTGRDRADRPLRRDAERNRQRILRTAHRVFAERGLDVSLDEIAQRADVGVGTVYRRFPTKEALVEELFERRLQEVVEIGQQALADPDPWRGLITFIDGACAQQAGDRGLREVMLGARYGNDRVARVRDSFQPIVAELVARAHAGGRLRADFAGTDVPLLAAMVNAVADYAREVNADVWRRYLTILIDGIAASRVDGTPLPVAPLDEDQVDRAMRSWHPHSR